MLNKLKQIFELANGLWHEDKYSFEIRCNPTDGWVIYVTHYYVNKTATHPEKTIFSSPITKENCNEVVEKLKSSFINRAIELSDFRKANCDEIYNKLKLASEDFSQRLFVLEKLKSL